MRRIGKLGKFLGNNVSEEEIKSELKKIIDKHKIVHLEVTPPRDMIV
jgi:hypothetical protein